MGPIGSNPIPTANFINYISVAELAEATGSSQEVWRFFMNINELSSQDIERIFINKYAGEIVVDYSLDQLKLMGKKYQIKSYGSGRKMGIIAQMLKEVKSRTNIIPVSFKGKPTESQIEGFTKVLRNIPLEQHTVINTDACSKCYGECSLRVPCSFYENQFKDASLLGLAQVIKYSPFVEMGGESIYIARKDKDDNKTCIFLSETGCILPTPYRPIFARRMEPIKIHGRYECWTRKETKECNLSHFVPMHHGPEIGRELYNYSHYLAGDYADPSRYKGWLTKEEAEDRQSKYEAFDKQVTKYKSPNYSIEDLII